MLPEHDLAEPALLPLEARAGATESPLTARCSRTRTALAAAELEEVEKKLLPQRAGGATQTESRAGATESPLTARCTRTRTALAVELEEVGHRRRRSTIAPQHGGPESPDAVAAGRCC